MLINNCRELWAHWMGGDEVTEDKSKILLEKWVFKGTDCGCIFGVNENGVYVGGYAEGSHAELPVHELHWGFTIDEWNAALDIADKEGVEEWNIANSEGIEVEDSIINEEEYDLGGEG